MDDEEAMLFVCRGYWDEMLSIAGGTPAEDPMVSWYDGGDRDDIRDDQVYVHIIGYAIPAMPAEEVLRAAGFSPQVSRYMTEPDLTPPDRVLQNDFEGGRHGATIASGMPTFEVSELMTHIDEVAHPYRLYDYESVLNALVGANVSINIGAMDLEITDDNNPDDYIYHQPTDDDYNTHPYEDSADAMHWSYREGSEPPP
jgi:hypothetical protein